MVVPFIEKRKSWGGAGLEWESTVLCQSQGLEQAIRQGSRNIKGGGRCANLEIPIREVLWLLTSPRENHRQRPEGQVQMLGMSPFGRRAPEKEPTGKYGAAMTNEGKPPRK